MGIIRAWKELGNNTNVITGLEPWLTDPTLHRLAVLYRTNVHNAEKGNKYMQIHTFTQKQLFSRSGKSRAKCLLQTFIKLDMYRASPTGKYGSDREKQYIFRLHRSNCYSAIHTAEFPFTKRTSKQLGFLCFETVRLNNNKINIQNANGSEQRCLQFSVLIV